MQLNNSKNIDQNIRIAAFSWLSDQVEIHGDMTFSQTDPSLMKWGKNSALKLSGTSLQSIEMGGYDYGADASGFSNNFSLEKLIIEGEVYLTDLIDNGNGGGVFMFI